MMLVVVALQVAEVSPGFSDMMQGVVGQIVNQIAANKSNPVYYPQTLVVREDEWIDCVVSQCDEDYGQNGWKHQTIAKQQRLLRVDRKHVMDSMQQEVNVAHHLVVWKVLLGMEDESMQDVLQEREAENSQDKSEDSLSLVDAVPFNLGAEQVSAEYEMQGQNVIPFVMGGSLHPVSLEHPWGIDEQPVRGVHQRQILLVVEIPDLLHQWFRWVDHLLDFLGECPDHHAVRHPVSQDVMGFQLMGQIFVFIGHYKAGSACISQKATWVVLGETCDIEYLIFVDNKNFVCGCSVLLYFVYGLKLHYFNYSLLSFASVLFARIRHPRYR